MRNVWRCSTDPARHLFASILSAYVRRAAKTNNHKAIAAGNAQGDS